jgi:hypothetical protein
MKLHGVTYHKTARSHCWDLTVYVQRACLGSCCAGIATKLRAGGSEVRIPAGIREFSPKCLDKLSGPLSLLFKGSEVLSQGQSDCSVNLTTHHLLLSLKVSGAIPLLPLYASIAWTGTTEPLYYYNMLRNIPVPPPTYHYHV